MRRGFGTSSGSSRKLANRTSEPAADLSRHVRRGGHRADGWLERTSTTRARSPLEAVCHPLGTRRVWMPIRKVPIPAGSLCWRGPPEYGTIAARGTPGLGDGLAWDELVHPDARSRRFSGGATLAELDEHLGINRGEKARLVKSVRPVQHFHRCRSGNSSGSARSDWRE